MNLFENTLQPDQASIPLTIEQGASFVLPIDCVDANDDPIILQGCTAKMKIRSSPTAEEPLVELTTENGGITISESQGVVTCYMTAEATAAFPAPWSGLYNIDVTNSAGVVARIMKGTVSIVPQVNQEDA